MVQERLLGLADPRGRDLLAALDRAPGTGPAPDSHENPAQNPRAELFLLFVSSRVTGTPARTCPCTGFFRLGFGAEEVEGIARHAGMVPVDEKREGFDVAGEETRWIADESDGSVTRV